MKKISLMLAAVLVMLSLAACAKAAPSSGTQSEETKAAAGSAAVETRAAETKAPETMPEKTEAATEAVTAEESTLPRSMTADWFEISENKEVLTVRLDSNPTTGYMWEYKISDDKVFELLTDEYVGPEDNGMVGAGGQWVASFKPTFLKDGDVKLTLMYKRSWESQPIQSIEMRIIVQGRQFSVIDINEMSQDSGLLEDGTWKVTIDARNLNPEGEEGVVGYVQIKKPVVLSDEDIQDLKAGDIIPLDRYGLGEFYVEEYKKNDDGSIDLGAGTLVKKDDLGGWIIVGLDDDVESYVDREVFVSIPTDVEFDDQMGKIVFSGEKKFDTFWDAAQEYHVFDAELTVKDGVAEKAVIFYHP